MTAAALAQLPLEALLGELLARVETAAARGAARGVRAELDRADQMRRAEMMLAAPELPELLTAKQAAKALGITVPALDKRLRRAFLPRAAVIGAGKARRFHRDLILEARDQGEAR